MSEHNQNAPIKIKGEKNTWEIVIGLEVHAQINSKSKLFSAAPTSFGSEPNENVSLIDAAMPGMLPVINSEAVDQAIRTGHALNSVINEYSVFDRKNYFYADLPQGYQISQYSMPIVGEGWIDIDLSGERTKRIGIERLHLEQDAGKSIHDMLPDSTLIDLNRAGIPLMEIVSRPDMSDWNEAGDFLKKLRNILKSIGSCDGNMEEGSLRCDANVSVRLKGEKLGTRCEIKNINSIKFMMKAIEYEANRQVKLLENGSNVLQETRLYDSHKSITRPMRSKEEAHDYRYFPDPDLPPLVLDKQRIIKLKETLPELPDTRRKRFMSDLGLSKYDAGVLTAEKNISDFYEEVSKKRDPKLVANWIITNLFGLLNENNKDISESPITTDSLAELLGFIEDGSISNRIAKNVFEEMYTSSKSAKEIISEKNLRQLSNEDQLTPIIKNLLEINSDQVEQYLNGNAKVIGWFVGQIMKETKGKANPSMVNKILVKMLREDK